MNDLLAAQALLAHAMVRQPCLALANVVAWLDPSHILTHHAGVTDEDLDEDESTLALRICRQIFPEVYAGAMQLVWQGADGPTLDRALLDGINAHLVMKLDSLEEIPGGIPVELLGISFYEEDFFENYPHLADVLADFDIQPDCTDEAIRRACELATALSASLAQQSGTTYRNVCSALSWLFASSGNTCIDLTTEEFWESGIELLDWEAENIAEMNAMAIEALSILDEAEAGIHALRADSILREAFRHNIHQLRSARLSRDRKKGANVYDRYSKRLQWPERP